MPVPTHEEKWVAAAVLYVERFGFSVIPMSEDKRPMIKWLEYQDRTPSMKEILSWPKENLGIVTGTISGIVVVDCESREDAEWCCKNLSKTPSVVQTRRGFHLYYRHPGVRIKNGIRVQNRYDVRGDGGYVLAPPSRHSAGAYRWVCPLSSVEELPQFQTKWRPDTEREQSYEKVIRDGVKYITSIKAVSGQGGHNDTYRAACILRESGYSEAEALLAMQEWNQTNADPPWSPKELLHKIKEAYS